MPEDILAILADIVSSIGPTVFIPIVFTLVGIVLGMGFLKSLRAGLAFGIGLVGIFAVLDIFLGALGPIASALVETVGFPFKAIDMGWIYWEGQGYIWWGMPIQFAVGVLFNILLLFLGTKYGGTDSIDVYDITSVFGTQGVSAYVVYFVTGNFLLAMATLLICNYVIFRVGDWCAPLSQDPESFGLAGITFFHPFAGLAPKSLFIDKYILSKIPFIGKVRADPKTIRERYGVIADPVIIGTLVGLALGLVAMTTGMITIYDTLGFAIASGAGMLLMPRMIGVLMEGATPIGDGVRAWTEKYVPGRRIWVGMDWALASGHATMLALNTILIPVVLIEALVLPGNFAMPYADLALTMPLALWFVASSKGHLFRSFLGAAIMQIPLMYLMSYAAPMCTASAISLGMEVPAGFLATSIVAAWCPYNVMIPIIMLYLFGGATGIEVLTGGLFSPVIPFYFSIAWIVTDVICWWLCRDDPVRIAGTPMEELFEKGMRPLEEIKAAKK